MRTTRTDYKTELRDLLSDRMRAGSWTAIYLNDLEHLNPRQAVVLGLIANLAKERADEDGWLLLTPAYLRQGPLRLSHTTQEELLGALCQLGLVTVKSRNGTRVVRLNLAAYRSLAAGTLTTEDDDDQDDDFKDHAKGEEDHQRWRVRDFVLSPGAPAFSSSTHHNPEDS